MPSYFQKVVSSKPVGGVPGLMLGMGYSCNKLPLVHGTKGQVCGNPEFFSLMTIQLFMASRVVGRSPTMKLLPLKQPVVLGLVPP